MRCLAVAILAAFCLAPVCLRATEQQEILQEIQPPEAKAVPVELEKHGHVRVDDYYWLRRRDEPEVMEYLKAENAYTEAATEHTRDLQRKLFEEIKGRIKQTDVSAPYKKDDYFYYTRHVEGKEYPIYCRKRGSLDAPEEVMLDVNFIANGHAFFDVGSWDVSFGQNLLAYTADTLGRRFYTVHLKDLTTDELLPDAIPEVTSNIAWANDDRTLFYAKQDPVTLRRHRIYRHVLGTDPATDELVYEETDSTFWCSVSKTKSRKYLLIESEQTLSTEVRYLDAGDPAGTFRVLQQREREHEYYVDHYADYFYVRTNWQAENFRLMRTRTSRTGKDHWEEIIPLRDAVLLEGFELFRNHLVLEEREEGLIRIRVAPWSGSGEHYVQFDEPAYLAWVDVNHEFDTPVVRYGYTSMKTPKSIIDYNMVTRNKTLVKQDDVLGGFDPHDHHTERLLATAADGVRVPVSLVFREGIQKDGRNPLLLYGYGSYGASADARFSSSRLSLIDRGFVCAIAHVRGGEELGRWWYEDGKLLKKKNTFTDFIACAEHLIAEGFTSPDRLFALGESAGGLLVGAVMNMRPGLFRGVVAYVPFVDVLTTMLDAAIPLTTAEYDEWGNPNVEEYYDYILSYSPYDNVEAKAYPSLLVTTSLQDSAVQYWEPAKWVAKLRALKTDTGRVLLRTYMEAGHGGVSGRYKQYRETAFVYAFLLDLIDAHE